MTALPKSDLVFAEDRCWPGARLDPTQKERLSGEFDRSQGVTRRIVLGKPSLAFRFAALFGDRQ
jgi:hypothetical protein